jgi:transposase
MKQLIISNAQQAIIELQEEIRRSRNARYDHRLHAILLVAQGMPCPEVAQLLGDGTRTVQMWIHQFENEGMQGLMDTPRPGRPPRLTEDQLSEISRALHSTPIEYGLTGHLWDGKTLSAFIEQEYGVRLGVRQCQRLFRRLGFRYRKPRPLIAGTDPEVKEMFKKNSDDDARP